jgi:hypothetical protein
MRTEMEFADINLTEDSSLFLRAIHCSFYWRNLKKTKTLLWEDRVYAQKSWLKTAFKNSISGHETWRGGKNLLATFYIPNFFLLRFNKNRDAPPKQYFFSVLLKGTPLVYCKSFIAKKVKEIDKWNCYSVTTCWAGILLSWTLSSGWL